MTIEEAKDIFSEYHTGEVIDYDYAIELVAKYCNKKKQIDEKKLDELAYNYAVDASDYDEIVSSNDISAFKEGYRKAKEE